MGTKVKGIYKGVKYTLSQIFVVKEEHEMEIGCPTDVKHVSHIGWDGNGPSGSAPSWMNEFKTGSNFAAASIGNSGSALSPWSSQDFRASIRQQQESEMCKDISTPTDLPNIKKKQKRKKTKSTTSSPKSNSSTSKSRAAAKAKTNFAKGNVKPTIEVEVA